MSNFLNTIMVVSVLSILFGALRLAWNLVSGRMRPLPRKSMTTDDPERSGVAWSSSPSDAGYIIDRLSDRKCPLHNKPYEAVAYFALVEPKQELNVFRQTATVVAQIHIALCADCIPEACTLRSSGFVWARKNYKNHPDWGSEHLYPHLLGSKIARLWSVTRKSDDGDSWQEVLHPVSTRLFATAPSSNSCEAIIQRYAPHLKGENIYVGSSMPEKKFQKARERYAPIGSDTPLVFLYRSSDWGLVLTDRHVYVGDLIEPRSRCLPLSKMTDVSKRAACHADSVSDCIDVDEECLYSMPVTPATDYLILLLRELAACARSTAEAEQARSGVSGLAECPKCERPVLPTSDGKCPGCGRDLNQREES